MIEKLIDVKTAKLAKEKGFIFWQPWGYYSRPDDGLDMIDSLEKVGDYLPELYAPTQSLLQKWLREVHEVFVLVNFYGKESFWIEILNSKGNMIYDKSQDKDYNSYESALEDALLEALKLIK